MCNNCGCDSRDITLPEGVDGVGISSITLNGSNQFVITYTNGTSVTTSAVTITATGTNILHNDTTSETESYTEAAGSSDAQLITAASQLGTKTYTLPIATVTTDGSEIRATAWFTASPLLDYNYDIRHWIYCNGAWFSTTFPKGGWSNTAGGLSYRVKVEFTLTRKSNTTVAASFQSFTYLNDSLLPIISSGDFQDTPAALGAFNFTTTTVVFGAYAAYYSQGSDASLDITCEKFIVEHYKK
jgi:hypothetical protein